MKEFYIKSDAAHRDQEYFSVADFLERNRLDREWGGGGGYGEQL